MQNGSISPKALYDELEKIKTARDSYVDPKAQLVIDKRLLIYCQLILIV